MIPGEGRTYEQEGTTHTLLMDENLQASVWLQAGLCPGWAKPSDG